MPAPVFQSEDTLRQAFLTGLGDLLEYDSTGTFILVLANAAYDPQVRARLEAPLRARFEALAGHYRECLREGREPAAPADDLAVFLRVMAIGFDSLQPAEGRRAGPWELQFNPVRALRPARMSGARPEGIHRPFDPDGFHFNKPFLRKEVFWKGGLAGREVELLYNKFPFAPLHGLLVPEREAERPQFLDRAMHGYAWQVTEALGATLPGVGLGYNSYGACASVNHLHFQMFVRPEPLPVADPSWRHNGGDRPYPTDCRVFDDPDEGWAFLEALHARQVPYNLVYQPGRLYCLPRRGQAEVEHAPWIGGMAWAEVAGSITTFNRADFDGLDAAAVAAELQRLRSEAVPDRAVA